MRRLTGRSTEVGPVRPLVIEAEWRIAPRVRMRVRRFSAWDMWLMGLCAGGLCLVADTMSTLGFVLGWAILAAFAFPLHYSRH